MKKIIFIALLPLLLAFAIPTKTEAQHVRAHVIVPGPPHVSVYVGHPHYYHSYYRPHYYARPYYHRRVYYYERPHYYGYYRHPYYHHRGYYRGEYAHHWGHGRHW